MNLIYSVKQKISPQIFFVYVTLAFSILSLGHIENVKMSFDVKSIFFVVPLFQSSLLLAPLVFFGLSVGHKIISLIILLSIQIISPLIIENLKLRITNLLCIILLVPLLFSGFEKFNNYIISICVFLKLFDFYYQNRTASQIEKLQDVITLLGLVGMVSVNQKLLLSGTVLIFIVLFSIFKKINRFEIMLGFSVLAGILTLDYGLLQFLIFINVISLSENSDNNESKFRIKSVSEKGLVVALFFIVLFNYPSPLIISLLLPTLFIFGQTLLEKKWLYLVMTLLASSFLFR